MNKLRYVKIIEIILSDYFNEVVQISFYQEFNKCLRLRIGRIKMVS